MGLIGAVQPRYADLQKQPIIAPSNVQPPARASILPQRSEAPVQRSAYSPQLSPGRDYLQHRRIGTLILGLCRPDGSNCKAATLANLLAWSRLVDALSCSASLGGSRAALIFSAERHVNDAEKEKCERLLHPDGDEDERGGKHPHHHWRGEGAEIDERPLP